MHSNLTYEQFDSAINLMMAGRDSASAEPELSELLSLASEVRTLPSPVFKARLQANLLTGNVVPLRVANVTRALFSDIGVSHPVPKSRFAISLAAHAAAVAFILLSTMWLAKNADTVKKQIISYVPLSSVDLPIAKTQAGGGGGGGERAKLDASQGAAPRMAAIQVAPPTVIVRNDSPKLAADPTVLGMPDMKMPLPAGDPLAGISGPASNGTGAGGGIGSGYGGGVGTGNGRGVGIGYGAGYGGGVFKVGGGVSAPRALYSPDPEYSEEARKAKFQGSVVLWAIIGPDGKPHDLRVSRSVGMGLDEKAIDAVRQWKFEPALKDGRPVAVQVNIEVNFRLY